MRIRATMAALTLPAATALPVTLLSTGPAAGAAPPPVAVCDPAAPVCAQIVGVGGRAFLGFTISSPASPPSGCSVLSFTLDGRPALGSLECVQPVPSSVRGNFTPASPLSPGMQVCMTVPWLKPAQYCATTPSPGDPAVTTPAPTGTVATVTFVGHGRAGTKEAALALAEADARAQAAAEGVTPCRVVDALALYFPSPGAPGWSAAVTISCPVATTGTAR